MADFVRNSVSKVKNNPLATIVGGFATYYILTKKYPASKVTTNTYMFVGAIVVGGFVGAYLSSKYKQSRV